MSRWSCCRCLQATDKHRNPRSEIRDGSTRPVNRDYFYIPLHPVIDAIKYKVSKLTSTIKAQYTPSEDRKEYVCLRCGTEWTELDVLSLVSDDGFVCQNCGAILQSTEEVKGEEGVDRSGHEKNSKLMAQLDKMLNLLKQIDSVEIPANDFDSAWDHKIDIARNQHTHPVRATVATHPAKQEAVRGGNAKVDTSALEISLTSTEEKTAVEQAEESTRKAELEKQNALPVWHTHSTVSTNAGNVSNVKPDPEPGAGGVQVKPEVKEEDEEEKKPAIDALDDRVAAYYAEMAKERALEAEQDASSADEDDSDDFDEEFEDVRGPSASDSATPAAGAAAAAPPTTKPAAGPSAPGIKRELDSDSPSTSAPQTTAPASPSTPADEGPAAKKVKVDNEAGAGIKREPEPEVKKEESDEDEEEFEDV